MKTIGAPIPHPSKPNDWKILAQVVKAHKAAGPFTLEERGSPVPCNMKKHHTMVTGSKVTHIQSLDDLTIWLQQILSHLQSVFLQGKV